MPAALRIDGLCAHPGTFSLAELAQVDSQYQIPDVSAIDPKRKGSAIKLAGLLSLVRPNEEARYVGLHAARDNFHASVPLAAVLERAFVIYQVDGAPLSEKAGGPFRFYIQDFASCHAEEVDECANVKFVDHIELTAAKGFDNRPEDEAEHAALHHPPQG